MMRVLHVLEAVSFGTGRHLVDLIHHTSEAVEHHVVMSAGRPGEPAAEATIGRLGGRVASVHVVPMRRLPAHPRNAQAALALGATIRGLKPHLVHSHASIAGGIARPVARLAGVPSVWTPNGVRTDRPTVLAERALAKITALTIAVSASEAERMVRLRVARRDRLAVIPNGVDLGWAPPVDRRTIRADLGIPDDALAVGFVGRLAAQKAPLDFVHAMHPVLSARPQTHAVMVGSGPLEDQVLRVAGALPAHRFHHVVADADAAELLPGFDVFVLPSHYEGAPYTPLEAMRAGVPVVVSSGVGARDVVVDGESGRVFPVGDIAALARAVGELADDPALRRRLATAAAVRLAGHFDVREMGRATEEAYGRAFAEARKARR